MSPQQKATPGENSGGRTLLSVTQVSGLPARPPSLPERRKDNPEIPPGLLVGLGQSHLSQKIPATTTRCVYLDHLLSVPSTWRSLLPISASYKGIGYFSGAVPLLNAVPQEVERAVCAPLPYGLARASPGREVQLLGRRPAFVRNPDEDESYRLLLGSPVGTGDSGNGEPVVGAADLAY